MKFLVFLVIVLFSIGSCSEHGLTVEVAPATFQCFFQTINDAKYKNMEVDFQVIFAKKLIVILWKSLVLIPPFAESTLSCGQNHKIHSNSSSLRIFLRTFRKFDFFTPLQGKKYKKFVSKISLKIAIPTIFGMGKTMVMFKNVENDVYSRASYFGHVETHVSTCIWMLRKTDPGKKNVEIWLHRGFLIREINRAYSRSLKTLSWFFDF